MAGKTSGRYRVWKWLAGILALLVLLVGAGAIYLSSRWKPLLTEKIKTGVFDGSKGLYRISFRDISLNLLTGSATLDEVSLIPDTAVFNKLKASKKAPAHLFEIKLKRLQFSRIHILRAYFKKKVEMNAIVLKKPSINLIYNKLDERPDAVEDERSLYQQISQTLKSVHVGTIKIEDADFDYINGSTSRSMNSVKHLNITVNDLLIDSLAQFDSTRFFYTKDINFELTGYRSLGKDKMYTMKIDTIAGSAKGQFVRLKGFQMIPMYPDLAFSRKYTYGKDRYDLNFDEIRLNGVDFVKLNDEGVLHAKVLKIGPAKAAIFVNRELPAPPGFDKLRNFPHVAVKRIPVPTAIDSIVIDNVDVAYTEYNPMSEKKGTIYFQNLKGNILNVTNDSARIAVNHHAVASLTALVMKTSRINVLIDFDLKDKYAAFTYRGTVAPMNMLVLNPMAKNMGLVEISSGRMQKVTFDIQANSRGSSGIVQFNYTDLNVKLLKAGEDGKGMKKKGLLSFLANTLLIKNNNPDEGQAPRKARIKFTRTPAASFFNQLWKGVFIGIRETVGLSVVPVKTPEEAMKKVKDKLKKKDGD
ncbi:MAG TPA: hypothetical protein VKB19_18345 [Pedobacter sp.]|nr:hypothetical protein [Pedobacter sp.]